MKDIYSPLEIDEEWDNFSPTEAVAPAPLAPGTRIEVQGPASGEETSTIVPNQEDVAPVIPGDPPETQPVNIEPGTTEPETSIVGLKKDKDGDYQPVMQRDILSDETPPPQPAAGGSGPPNDPPTNDLSTLGMENTKSSVGMDSAVEALPTVAANDEKDSTESNTASSLDMDNITTDPAREAAMNAMGGTETSKKEPEPEPLNKDEIIAKWGGENTADTSDSDTLEVNEIGGTAKNEANVSAETENKNDADNPVAIKVPVGEDDMPKPEEDVNPMLSAEMDNTKAEKPSSPDNDAIAGAVENLLKAIEDKIGELENGLEAANKEKTVLDQQVLENASSIEGMQKDLADLKAQYDKAKDMAPNGPM